MNGFKADIFKLIKSAVSGQAVELSNGFDWAMAREYGRSHKILPLLYYGAFNSELSIPVELKKEFSMSLMRHVMHSENQLFELNRIKEKFDQANIDYVILKGSGLKACYPKPEMRPMGDIDILIRLAQYEEIKPIMLELGFEEDGESDHELIWVKGAVMVELHKRLIPSYNEDYYAFFGDGWSMAAPKFEGSKEYIFSAEDNFIYLFTHFAKHYRDAGIGILHFVDLYVYLKHFSLDAEYLKSALSRLCLYEFYCNILKTLEMCFDGGEVQQVCDLIIDRIFGSGSYGTRTAQAVSTAAKKTKDVKNKGNIRFVLFMKRVFMPYNEMCRRHGILKKLPFLLPVLWIYRIFSVSVFKSKNIKEEIGKLKVSDADSVSEYYNELKAVGLDFNFKE